MPQLLVSPPRIPPEQLPANFQFQPDNNVANQCDPTPDTVVSNALVPMDMSSSDSRKRAIDEADLDQCATDLINGGSVGNFAQDIQRCMRKRAEADALQAQMLMNNLERRRQMQQAIPDTVVSNPNALVPSQCDPTPDTVVSNALVPMDMSSSDSRKRAIDEADLDQCATDLINGGSVGNFAQDIQRCMRKRAEADALQAQMLMNNLERRRQMQQAIPDTVVSNPNALVPSQCDPTPDTVVSNALVPMRRPPPLPPGVKNWLNQRQQRRCNYLSGRRRIPYDTSCAPRLENGLPEPGPYSSGWASGLPALVGSTPILSTPILPDTVISNSEVNIGGTVPDTVISYPIEEIDEQPAENYLA